MKKCFVFILMIALVLVSICCGMFAYNDQQDMSEVIEAKCQSINNHVLVVTIHRVYGFEVTSTPYATYNVDISNAELEIDQSVFESKDYPIWIIPAQTFEEDNRNITAEKIGGYSN